METNVCWVWISDLAMVKCLISSVLVNRSAYRTVLVKMHLVKNEHEKCCGKHRLHVMLVSSLKKQ